MNMKAPLVLTAAASFGLASLAAADETWNPANDLTLNIPTIAPLTATAAGPVNFEAFSITATADVVGFSFEGFFESTGATAAWASDTRLGLEVNGVEVSFVGGFPTPPAGFAWDFQGSQSAGAGPYFHGLDADQHGYSDPFGHPPTDGLPDFKLKNLASAGDVITFVFSNDWSTDLDNVIEWSDVVITLHQQGQVPAPGALALLGVAGLIGVRRRRS